MKVLIDADSILFKAACVAKVKGSADEYIDGLFEVRQRIDQAFRDIESYCFADEMYVAVKGRGNFRYDIFPGYKSHRKELGDNLRKRLNHAHEHTLNKWNAVQADGMEADDLVSIWAHEAREAEEDFIVAHIDKDLNQIAGNHYNYDKQEVYFKDDSASYLDFCIQLITGDSSDGIPGLKRGLGIVGAKNILEPLADDDYMDAILALYARHYGNGYRDRLNLIGNLLWMKRTWSEELEFNYEDYLKDEDNLSEPNECLQSGQDSDGQALRSELSDS